MAAHYERLRAAALGSALPAEARRGLGVLLHRGLWAWACTIALGAACQEPRPASAASPTSQPDRWPDERRSVVHLLATMAMANIDRRTT